MSITVAAALTKPSVMARWRGRNRLLRKDLTLARRWRRMLRAGGYRRVAGRAARRRDVSNGVDAIHLPPKHFCTSSVPPRFDNFTEADCSI